MTCIINYVDNVNCINYIVIRLFHPIHFNEKETQRKWGVWVGVINYIAFAESNNSEYGSY